MIGRREERGARDDRKKRETRDDRKKRGVIASSQALISPWPSFLSAPLGPNQPCFQATPEPRPSVAGLLMLGKEDSPCLSS